MPAAHEFSIELETLAQGRKIKAKHENVVSMLGKYHVMRGIRRRALSFNTERVDHLYRDPHEDGVHAYLYSSSG
jgi:hypothetical protein